MKKNISLVAMVLGALFVVSCSQGDFEEYTSPDNLFSVNFPGEPKVTNKVEPGSITITTTTYSVDPKYGVIGHKYNVIVTELSTENPDGINLDVDKALEGAKEGIKSEGFAILSQKEITQGDLNGWEFESASDSSQSTIRLFIKGYTFYVIEIARKKGSDVSEESKEFLDSFKLL